MNGNSVSFQPFVEQKGPSRGLKKHNKWFMRLHLDVANVSNCMSSDISLMYGHLQQNNTLLHQPYETATYYMLRTSSTDVCILVKLLVHANAT